MNELLQNPTLLLLAGGVGLSLLMLMFAFAGAGGGRVSKRVDRIRLRVTQPAAAASELKLKRDAGDKRALDQLVRRLLPQPELLRKRLHRTGRHISLGSYAIFCVIVGACSVAGAFMSGLSATMAIPGGIILGLIIPHRMVGWLGKRRAMRFTVLFPEAIGLMVRSIKSGLPITESFQIVGAEIPDPVGSEFRQISDQIRLGQPIDQVLGDAAKRIATPEVQFLVVTLSVQRETGGNLAETLENLDNILRRRRQMKLKVKAMSSEARASAMIIGALPFVMMGLLSIVNNEYISLLFNRHLGHLMLGGGATSISMGIMVMAKMVRFEI